MVNVRRGKIFHTGKSGLDLTDWSDYFHTPTDVFSPVSRAVAEGCLNPLDDFGPISDKTQPLYDDRNLNYIKSCITAGACNTFWACGLYRPHLPFIVPQRFFDLINRPIESPLGLHRKPFDPNNDIEAGKLPKAAQRLIRRKLGQVLYQTDEYEDFLHAYLASIAYADSLVGELLDHMQKNGLLKNTLIVLWSDHGWQLGEKLAFRKFTLWERALRVPLIVSIPDGPTGKIAEPVSLLDIYPMLLRIIGKSSPHDIDGQDLFPLMCGDQGRNYALSMWEQFDRKLKRKSYLAASVRTKQYRLIRYHEGSLELYDHENDPFEHYNLLGDDCISSGSNIVRICEDLIDLLPQSSHKPLTPYSASNMFDASKLNTRHPKLNGNIFIT